MDEPRRVLGPDVRPAKSDFAKRESYMLEFFAYQTIGFPYLDWPPPHVRRAMRMAEATQTVVRFALAPKDEAPRANTARTATLDSNGTPTAAGAIAAGRSIP